MQEIERTLQSNVEQVIERFSIASVPIQKQGLECSLNCFQSFEAKNYKDIGNCVEKCQKPFQELGSVTNKEFQGLQRGVQTCQQSCMDVIQPQLDAIRSGLQKQPSEAEQKVMQANVEQCASKCITDHGIGKLTDVESRLMGYIKGFRLN
ncbi:unnamed protein product [Amoebophrya sp. A120]|nr:unnamed protein product [Amoebophrya sp. A120]|eukprot:GSA120T00025875001.1